jgi:hypothetical protein
MKNAKTIKVLRKLTPGQSLSISGQFFRSNRSKLGQYCLNI